MKRIYVNILLILAMALPVVVSAQSFETEDVFSEFSPIPAEAYKDQKVIVGKDTVSIILPQKNFGRYDRGLFNFLFIPKGQWSFGLTASYGEFRSEDVQLLNAISDFDFKGKLYSIKPQVGYAIRNNQVIGVKFNYTHGEADLGSLRVDFGDDLNFSIADVGYHTNSWQAGAFYRSYVGLSTEKRFAIFNEIDLSLGHTSSNFNRSYNDEPKRTHTSATTAALNFSPGLCMFIMDNVSFNVSFGVFGIRMSKETQWTNGERDGTRFSSGANFKFNLFNINFGIGVHI
ncbi:MAG: hypothetical protein J1E38_03555 [Paramuribaculum sp.]|nr:hypothetical protein [Paramuribaculum sp.]